MVMFSIVLLMDVGKRNLLGFGKVSFHLAFTTQYLGNVLRINNKQKQREEAGEVK